MCIECSETYNEDKPSLADLALDAMIAAGLVDESLEEPFSPEEEEMLLARDRVVPDRHGNVLALEGLTRCECGCKYWEHDRCIDCNGSVYQAMV